MTAKAPPFLTASGLEARLLDKYPQPAWITLNEVRDGTGFESAGRQADMLAFGVWPSRGLEIVGFEIKTSRSDWLRELKEPAKAESIARFCDQWWLVANEGVAQADEIPTTWGWYVGTEKGLKAVKAATPMTPTDLRRTFLMSIIRNIARNYVPANDVKAQAELRAEELVKQRSDSNRYELENLRDLNKRVLAFREASGVDLMHDWHFNAKEVGQIVKLVLDHQLPYEVRKMRDTAQNLKEALEALTALPFFEPTREELRGRK